MTNSTEETCDNRGCNRPADGISVLCGPCAYEYMVGYMESEM